MAEEKYDIVGIGNAIVDVLAFTDYTKLADLNLRKGAMTLIDEEQAEAIYRMMGPTTECSGGSVANTLAGVASLGGTAAFIGKVRNDQLGDIFRHDMRACGVQFDVTAAVEGPATARCLICVTPDAQRTMGTYLGICAQVNEDDVDEQLIAEGKIIYIEGYLWDQPNAIAAIRKALKIAKKHKKQIAFSLSDVFCVERHRQEFLELIDASIDILFANEDEIKNLYQVKTLEEAQDEVRGKCAIAALTCSEKGCVIVTKKKVTAIAAKKVAEVVDTTGAGDLFASGFLYGLTQGWDEAKSAELANHCAGEIIQQLGARTLKPLKQMPAANG